MINHEFFNTRAPVSVGLAFSMVMALSMASIAPSTAENVTLKGADALSALQKMTCGTTEQGVPRYAFFEGRVYSRVPGEKDTHIFNAQGINVRQCKVVEDQKHGKGYRSISREIMVYMDPETNEIVDTWENPWTGQTIDVMHVANDPVNMRGFRYEKDINTGKTREMTFRRYGDVAVSSSEIPLFYDNPLGGDYQKYVGGTYHAMEIFNDFYDAQRLLDPSVKDVGQSRIAWTRVAQWLPWLEMGSKPGLMVFNATGFSSFKKSDIPPQMMSILKTRYPLYLTPPGLDDDRENETSWTVFKGKLAEQE